MSFAIFRAEKHNNIGSLMSALSHCLRVRPTPNANPKVQNRILIGDPSAKAVMAAQIEADRSAGMIRNSRSVLAIETLQAASPEWFETASKADFEAWVAENIKWLKDRFGAENIGHATLHMDEKTPHISAFIYPRSEGKYNAKAFLGGRKTLSDLQTDYADRMNNFGLERGIKGSKARHQTVRKYYAKLNEYAAQNKEEAIQPPTALQRLNPDGYVKEINEKMAVLRAKATEAEVQRHEIYGLRDTSNRMSKDLHEVKAANKRIQDALRQVDLMDVVHALGLVQGQDKQWKNDTREKSVEINGQKFYDFKASKGGGGSYDLVMHVLDYTFQEASAWLADRFGPDVAVSEVRVRALERAKPEIQEAKRIARDVSNGTAKSFTPPKENSLKWPAVRNYLVHVRGLAAGLVDRLHELKRIYADDYPNVIFAGPRHAFRRAIEHGNPFRGMTSGSDKSEAWKVRHNDRPDDRLVIAESPIDALSYAQMHGIYGTLAATYGVAADIPENLKYGAWREIIIAYDNDETGIKAARKLGKAFSNFGFKNVKMHVPERVKDWNEALQSTVPMTRPLGLDELPARLKL